jgi:hypothetical protein
LGWKLPFRLLGARLDERSNGTREACLGFIALREKGAEAASALASLVPLNEQNSEVILDAIASIGAPGVGAISNALTSPSMLVHVAAARSAGLLGESGAPVVPLLISILRDPNEIETGRCAAARSLGMIGRPVELVLLALQDALASTNKTLRANAVVGLAMMRGSAKPVVPIIEGIILSETNQLSYDMVVGLVVLCEDDAQIERTLSRFQSQAAIPANDAQRSGATLRENLSAIRNGWTSQSQEGWEGYRSAVIRIVSGAAAK